jgi:ABC-type sugar transport system ATPase subunit
VLGMNCRDNMTLPQVDDLKAGPFVADGAEIAIFDQYRDRWRSGRPAGAATVGNLSGGNQQKIVIGKWLSMRPEVLIVDEPTRGIDVGSKSEIHNLLRELAKQGYAVIVISRCRRCCMSPTVSWQCITGASCANSPPRK